MRASVQRMEDRRDEVIKVISTARDLIAALGYQPFFRVNGGGPLNISSALVRACSDDYELQLLARQSFSSNWGGPVSGLLSWETEKRRTQSEVIDLLTKVLTRLESHETRPTGSQPRGRRAADST